MDQKLHKAIVATRAGQKRDAQLLLTEILRDDPEHVHAWFLLGNLVDSEQKRKAYLGKALALDPTHAQAKQQLRHLQAASAAAAASSLPISTHPDVFKQAEGDTIPGWMAEDEGQLVTAPPPVVAETPEITLDELTELPDWLQEQVNDDWDQPAPEAEQSSDEAAEDTTMADTTLITTTPKEPAEAKTAVSPSDKTDKQTQEQQLAQLNFALIGLSVLIFLVFVALIWSLFS